MRISLSTLAALLLFSCLNDTCSAQDPVKEINGLELEDGMFDAVDGNRMILLTSSDDAKARLSEENFEKLNKAVDFEAQRVVIFAWRGSGRDQISFDVAESWPEQVGFRYNRGRTRDLRSHLKVFALRSNVSCSVDGNPVDLNRVAKKKEFIQVEMQGKLELEEAGCTLTANGITLMVEFQDSDELLEAAEGLDGQIVIVTGELKSDGKQGSTNLKLSAKTLKPVN